VAKQNLLVVDADQRSLRVLEVSLRKAGYSVAACTDVASAMEMLSISPPDMIISDTRLPDVDGFTFVEELRDHAAWGAIPFMFLSSDVSVESKVRGLELGVEDYLTKPIYIKEIITRVNLVMSRKEREGIESRGTSGEKAKFTGSLADMGLVDLLQTIDIGKKSGVLYVTSGRQRGAVYFRDGQLVDAELGPLNGERAIYRALVWNEGSFEIDFRPVRREDAIRSSTQGILMEGMRRVDEWGRLLEQLPPLEHVFEVNDEALLERLAEIPDEINDVLKHFDGEQALLSVVDACGGDDLETLTTISKLYFEGLIFDTGRSKVASGASSRRPGRPTDEATPRPVSSRPPPRKRITGEYAMPRTPPPPPPLAMDDGPETDLVPGRDSMIPPGSIPQRPATPVAPTPAPPRAAEPSPTVAGNEGGAETHAGTPEDAGTDDHNSTETTPKRKPKGDPLRSTHGYGRTENDPEPLGDKKADASPATPPRGLHAVPPTPGEDDEREDDNVIRLRRAGTLRLVREPVQPVVDPVSETLRDLRQVARDEATAPTERSMTPSEPITQREIAETVDDALEPTRDTAEDFERTEARPGTGQHDEDDGDDGSEESAGDTWRGRPEVPQQDAGSRRKRKRRRRLSMTTSPGALSSALNPVGQGQSGDEGSGSEGDRVPSRPTQPDGLLSPVKVSRAPTPVGSRTMAFAAFQTPPPAEPTSNAAEVAAPEPAPPADLSKTLVGVSLTPTVREAAAETSAMPRTGASTSEPAPATRPEFTLPPASVTEVAAAMRDTEPATVTTSLAAVRDEAWDDEVDDRTTGENGWRSSRSESSIRPIMPPGRGKFAPAVVALVGGAVLVAAYSLWGAMTSEPAQPIKTTAPSHDGAKTKSLDGAAVTPTPKPEKPAQEPVVAEPAPEANPTDESGQAAEDTAGTEPVEGDPTVAAVPMAGAGESTAAFEDAMKRGRALERKGNTKGATEAFEEALTLDPNNSETLGKLAFHKLNRGKNAEAMEFANRAVTADPTNSEGWIVLGAARHALRDREGAREAYRSCAELGTGAYVQECRRMMR